MEYIKELFAKRLSKYIHIKLLPELIDIIPGLVQKGLIFPSIITLAIDTYDEVEEKFIPISWDDMAVSPTLDVLIPKLLQIFPSLRTLTYYSTHLKQEESLQTSLQAWIQLGLEKLVLPSKVSHFRLIFAPQQLAFSGGSENVSLPPYEYNTATLKQRGIFVLNALLLEIDGREKTLIDIINVREDSFLSLPIEKFCPPRTIINKTANHCMQITTIEFSGKLPISYYTKTLNLIIDIFPELTSINLYESSFTMLDVNNLLLPTLSRENLHFHLNEKRTSKNVFFASEKNMVNFYNPAEPILSTPRKRLSRPRYKAKDKALGPEDWKISKISEAFRQNHQELPLKFSLLKKLRSKPFDLIFYPSIERLLITNISQKNIKTLLSGLTNLFQLFPNLEILSYKTRSLPSLNINEPWIKPALAKIRLPSTKTRLQIHFNSNHLKIHKYNIEALKEMGLLVMSYPFGLDKTCIDIIQLGLKPELKINIENIPVVPFNAVFEPCEYITSLEINCQLADPEQHLANLNSFLKTMPKLTKITLKNLSHKKNISNSTLSQLTFLPKKNVSISKENDEITMIIKLKAHSKKESINSEIITLSNNPSGLFHSSTASTETKAFGTKKNTKRHKQEIEEKKQVAKASSIIEQNPVFATSTSGKTQISQTRKTRSTAKKNTERRKQTAEERKPETKKLSTMKKNPTQTAGIFKHTQTKQKTRKDKKVRIEAEKDLLTSSPLGEKPSI